MKLKYELKINNFMNKYRIFADTGIWPQNSNNFAITGNIYGYTVLLDICGNIKLTYPVCG